MARGSAKIVSVNGALTVTFTAASGATPVVFSDEACTTTVALPATVADGASGTFYFSAPGSYVLSVKTATGTEIAGDANNTRIIDVSTGQTATLAFDARLLAVISGDTGRSKSSSSGGGTTTLVYSGGAYTARPSVAAAPAGVIYVGPVQPTDWISGDIWYKNA